MKVLAAHDLQPVVVLIMLAFGLVNWLVGKLKTGGPPAAPPPPATPRTPVPRLSGNEEEDRMRRFLEALGVPAETPKPLPPRTPRPVRRMPAKPPPRPLRESSMEVEKITLPDLVVPAVSDFATVSSTVSAGPADFLVTLPAADEPGKYDAGRGPFSASVLAALRTPREVRAAFVLREILGLPRSLQPWLGPR